MITFLFPLQRLYLNTSLSLQKPACRCAASKQGRNIHSFQTHLLRYRYTRASATLNECSSDDVVDMTHDYFSFPTTTPLLKYITVVAEARVQMRSIETR